MGWKHRVLEAEAGELQTGNYLLAVSWLAVRRLHFWASIVFSIQYP